MQSQITSRITLILVRLTFFSSLILILCLASCSSIKVSYDFDRQANYSAYKTYGYTPEVATFLDDINRSRIKAAVDNELSAKGFTKSENPDVWIDLKITAEKKVSATSTPNYYGAGYGYRWGGGFSTSTINVDTYVEGTLFVDMIDVSKKQLVWQGRAVGTLDPDASASKRETNINYAVKQIFTKYPPKLK